MSIKIIQIIFLFHNRIKLEINKETKSISKYLEIKKQTLVSNTRQEIQENTKYFK